MTPRWFLKGVITSLIINIMGKYGEANNEENPEDSKYLEGLDLTHTAKDEKAFQKVKERIKDVLKQGESRTFYSPNDEGPRKYFYKKYMKLGKTRDESMDYDNKENQHKLQDFNKFIGDTAKNSEKKSRDFQELSEIPKKNMIMNKLNEYSQGDKWKMRIEPTVFPNRVNNYNRYTKENYSQLNNYLANSSSSLKNEEKYPKNIIHQTKELNTSSKINDENFRWLNSYMNQIKNQDDKYLEKHIQNEKNKITDYNNKGSVNRIISGYQEESSSVNSMLTSRSLKGSHYKKKRKCYKPDNIIGENKKTHESNKLQSNDRRRVRSCDVKMEDLRESFIPNEQLSIYHPKMSLSDQFILQDTMF